MGGVGYSAENLDSQITNFEKINLQPLNTLHSTSDQKGTILQYSILYYTMIYDDILQYIITYYRMLQYTIIAIV